MFLVLNTTINVAFAAFLFTLLDTTFIDASPRYGLLRGLMEATVIQQIDRRPYVREVRKC